MAERIKLFEIHVVDSGGNIIQPNTFYGLVTEKIAIPDDFDNDYLGVYRVLSDLPDIEFNEYIVTIGNKHYCKFKTDHFSSYALVDKKSDNYLWGNVIFLIFILLIIITIVVILWLSKNEGSEQSLNKLKCSHD